METSSPDRTPLGVMAGDHAARRAGAATFPPGRFTSPAIDQIGVEERAGRLAERSIKKDSKLAALHLALSMLDLTTLEGKDTDGKVRQLCYKARHLHDLLPG